MRGLVAVIGVAIVGVIAGSALAGMNGIWSGRFINPQEVGNIPTSAYPVARVVVRPDLITVQASGKTQAAHDPESATSTCVIRLRFVGKLSSDGWRLYEQFAKPAL